MSLLLAIETSAHIGALSLCGIGLALDESSDEPAVKLSAWLLPALARLEARFAALPGNEGKRLAGSISAIAFGAGPGAFTGVRTACATAQSLAYAWRKPLIRVDSLAALAEAARLPAVTVVLDARMNELFVASFERDANGQLARRSPTRLCTAHTLGARLGPLLGSGAALVDPTADIELTRRAEAHWAQGVARIAAGKLARGELTDPLHAEPIYVRNQVAHTESERRAARVTASLSGATA
jgi:tRNA threonylcarbamoyladenosine biosynthesis protein TsaB